jgi:short subunit dehydrogenase-like uncharacterized protein
LIHHITMSTRTYDIVIFGATGYTGKLAAEYVAVNLPTDLKWAISGRNASKLAQLAEELKGFNPDRTPPALEPAGLTKDEMVLLAKKTRVMLACVGPYMFYGEPVLAACAENGTHYIDW